MCIKYVTLVPLLKGGTGRRGAWAWGRGGGYHGQGGVGGPYI